MSDIIWLNSGFKVAVLNFTFIFGAISMMSCLIPRLKRPGRSLDFKNMRQDAEKVCPFRLNQIPVPLCFLPTNICLFICKLSGQICLVFLAEVTSLHFQTLKRACAFAFPRWLHV